MTLRTTLALTYIPYNQGCARPLPWPRRQEQHTHRIRATVRLVGVVVSVRSFGARGLGLSLMTHLILYSSGKFNAQDTDVLTRCIHGHDVMLEVPGGKSVSVKPDVLIVNQGVWYNAPAGHRHIQVQEAKLREDFHQGIAVPLMQRNATRPILIWRETAPQRFNTPGGLFAIFQKVDRLRNVSCERRPVAELHRYNWRNTALEPEFAILGDRIRILPIFDLSARYPKVDQPKAADCTHFALPGLPDTWSHLLLAALVLTRGRRGHQRSGSHIIKAHARSPDHSMSEACFSRCTRGGGARTLTRHTRHPQAPYQFMRGPAASKREQSV